MQLCQHFMHNRDADRRDAHTRRSLHNPRNKLVFHSKLQRFWAVHAGNFRQNDDVPDFDVPGKPAIHPDIHNSNRLGELLSGVEHAWNRWN